MDSGLTPLITKLAKGEILRIDDAKGHSVVVASGMLWITQEGDSRDIFLTDGDSFVFDRRGTALAQAITDASLIALVGEAAEVIEPAVAPVASEAQHGHRGSATSIPLHQGLAALLGSSVPAHRLA